MYLRRHQFYKVNTAYSQEERDTNQWPEKVRARKAIFV